MYLKKLKISNFRSFGESETVIDFEKNNTTFIGANSTGKTTILFSLLKLFGTKQSERQLERSDFHLCKNENPGDVEERDLYIEAIFVFDELSSVTDATSTVPHFSEYMVVDRVGEIPYIRIRLEAKWEKGSNPEGEIEEKILIINCPETSPEIKDENKIQLKNYLRSEIQFIYIPSIRQPSSQLKMASGTILWRLLNGIKWEDDFEQKIKEETEGLKALFKENGAIKTIIDEISGTWKKYHKDVRYSNTDIVFSPDDLDAILKRVEITFSPTETEKSFDVEKLGEGLRSLFYLSLVNSLLAIEQEHASSGMFNIECPAHTIIAIEEPENHIHPHLLGKILKNIKEISEKAQVLLTSHSASIVGRIDPESIRHLRVCQNQHCTVAKKLKLPDSSKTDEYKYFKEAVWAYPELYFARLVILCEGDTEQIIIPKAIKTVLDDVDSCGISVVPLGGRHINHFWRLLKSLDIPYITLLDLDTERQTGDWARIKYIIDQLIVFGIKKRKLITEDEETSFELMHTWTVDNIEDRELLSTWVCFLEKNNVYFSSPLDMDFCMLQSYFQKYKDTIESGCGPRIPDKANNEAEFEKYKSNAVRKTLKECGGEGNSYTDDEKEIMLYYPYFFLNKSKPETHIKMLSILSDDDLKKNLPESIEKIIAKVNDLLKED